VQILEYIDVAGASPYRDWFESLNAPAAAKVTVALTRIELGNLSNVKSVGAGVQEYRIDFGPGYRVYFGRDGDRLVILLAGGTKSRQQRDIVTAQQR
jgi:putative addiction module killer protein